MSPQLQESVRHAAEASLCSVNAFIVQILASAVGDPARFRASVERGVESQPPELERDHRGYPIRPRDRDIHIAARNRFMTATEKELGAAEMFRLAKHHDANNPGHYVEWQRAQDRAKRQRSADAAGVMAEGGDEAAAFERAQRALRLGVDDDGFAGLAAEDEGDDTVVAGGGAGHGAVGAVDGSHVHDREHDGRV
jgi:hypothetical protein